MTQQFRLSLPDDVYAGMERYNAVNRSTLFTLALNTIMPIDLKPHERDARLMAALQGRLKVTVMTEAEYAEEKARQSKPANKLDPEGLQRLRDARAKQEAEIAAAAEATKKRAEEQAKPNIDPKSGLTRLPPMAVPTGGDDPLGMTTPQIPLGGNARDHD